MLPCTFFNQISFFKNEETGAPKKRCFFPFLGVGGEKKNFHQNYAPYFSRQNGVQQVDLDLQLQGQIMGQTMQK